MDYSKSNSYFFDDDPDIAKALQRLAREEMKLRLLQDISMDITVCQIEGWDYKPYLRELKQEIERFL